VSALAGAANTSNPAATVTTTAPRARVLCHLEDRRKRPM